MRFFRGIAVPAAAADKAVATSIRDRPGEGAGWWRMFQCRPKQIDELFAKPDLSLQDTRPEAGPENAAVCVCGEPVGASYYAWWHNRSKENDAPILLEFDVEREAVAV